ncbi:baseplate J-like protein [Clostridium puniceum]|uniref:Baseplate J-like protein n=1 Tax=Clostridium puniceum TaxID=29367 RepID=A0A1S8TW05_9CLOT|nr:baseplate J/gp47 family protein [Clostridium puniceum]OOM81799.1 baseplate J-like protein [Clostridium puniceum]
MADDKETIQSRMMSNISNQYDRSEGAFFYDSAKPVAIELEGAYKKADAILKKRYGYSATGAELDKVVAEEGLIRKKATKARGTVTITGTEGSLITKGEYVASDATNFMFLENAVIPSTKTIDVSVECIKFGTVGNVPVGAIKFFPKTLDGLQTVTSTEDFKTGYEEETDEELRERYYIKIQTPSTSGNKYHYKNWALAVTGVGGAKVFPLWNGNGTVKVVIADSNKRSASLDLITKVKMYIDPYPEGNGEGQAPIGATVTITSAVEKAINITANVTLALGIELAQVKAEFESLFEEYLKSVSFKTTYISIAKIGNLLLNTAGVIDYVDLKLNNAAINLPLLDEEIAVSGIVNLGVVT